MSDSVKIPGQPSGAEAPANQQQQANQPAGGERPAWLPEKFKTPEDMAKAYGELETKLGQSGQQQQQQQQQQTQPGQQNQQQPNKNEEPGKKGSLEINKTQQQADPFAKFEEEFSANGKLSDESYTELAAQHGLSRQHVDAFITGLQAQAERDQTALLEPIGGREAFDAMAQWAGQNLNDEELSAFNKVITSGDLHSAKLAVQGLHARYVQENGHPAARRIEGDRGAMGNGAQPFSSWHDFQQAIRDPRYKSGDKAFHAEVDRRLAVSNL